MEEQVQTIDLEVEVTYSKHPGSFVHAPITAPGVYECKEFHPYDVDEAKAKGLPVTAIEYAPEHQETVCVFLLNGALVTAPVVGVADDGAEEAFPLSEWGAGPEWKHSIKTGFCQRRIGSVSPTTLPADYPVKDLDEPMEISISDQFLSQDVPAEWQPGDPVPAGKTYFPADIFRVAKELGPTAFGVMIFAITINQGEEADFSLCGEERHVKRALRDLTEAGYLNPDGSPNYARFAG